MELLALLGALAVSLLVVGRLAHTAGRGELMFLDGDSQVVRLLARSVVEGQPLDWALSPVLFVPETVLYAALMLSGLGAHGMAILSGVVNLVLLYAGLRFVTGGGAGSPRGVSRAGVAYLLFAAATLLEGDGGRDDLELTSLLAMTTYYGSTIVAVLSLVGLARRAFDSVQPSRVCAMSTVLVSAVSTVSNPLFVAWGTAPVVLIVLVLARRADDRRGPSVFAAAAVVGAGLGGLARLAFGSVIVADGSAYVDPTGAGASFAYYGALVLERLSTPGGAVSVCVAVALVVVAARASLRRPAHERPRGERLVLAFTWVAPVSTTVGMVLLGTHAARYLQTWAFAPVLCVLLLPALPRLRPVVVRIAAVVGAAALVAAALAGTNLVVTSRTDRSLTCATDWVNAQDRTGAGLFWSIRAIKANIDHPERLVQVDQALFPYSWLVNRTDYRAFDVRFVITDSQSAPFALPQAPGRPAPTVIDCGRWTITDYGDVSLTAP